MLKFLIKIHDTAWSDKWGWTHHKINDIILSTNSIAYTAFNEVGRKVELEKIMLEYLK